MLQQLNWETCNFDSGINEAIKTPDSEINSHSKQIHQENEQKRILQLNKLQDPRKYELRKTLIDAAARLGDLIIDNNSEQTIRTLLTEDCESFLFNLAEIVSVKYAVSRDGFLDLYKGTKVLRRQVKEVNADVDTKTAFQICYYEIMNEKDNSIISQFAFESFLFRDDKISKYRAQFGTSSSFTEFNNPFTPTAKDQMLAKVRELNYAWAGQPNLEKIAALLHSSTEYKIWSWEAQKAFTFYKKDIASNFNKLENNYIIKCVVPYDAESEGQFIMGNYVFHLEGKNERAGQKFLWLSTCIYSFDKDLNIAKINQQGELHKEGDVEIPFGVYSRDKHIESIKEAYLKKEMKKKDFFLLDTTNVVFSLQMSRFCPKNTTDLEWIQGFKEFNKWSQLAEEKHRDYEWAKPIDIHVDLYDPSYDTIIIAECLKGALVRDNYQYSGVDMNFIAFKKFCVENGKMAKAIMFFTEIPSPIPSPFDDQSFTAQNILSKNSEKWF